MAVEISQSLLNIDNCFGVYNIPGNCFERGVFYICMRPKIAKKVF